MMLYTFFVVLLRFIILSYLTAQLMNSMKSCSYFPVENGKRLVLRYDSLKMYDTFAVHIVLRTFS